MSIYKHKYFLILLFFINQFIFISCVVAQRNTNTVNNGVRDGDEDLFDDNSGENDKNQGSSDIPYSSGEVLDNSINYEEQTQTQTQTQTEIDNVSSTSNEKTPSTTITKATEKIETSYTIQTATNKDNEPTSISETNTIPESQKSSQEIQPTENIEIEPEENIQKIKYESCEDIQPTNGIIDDCKKNSLNTAHSCCYLSINYKYNEFNACIQIAKDINQIKNRIKDLERNYVGCESVDIDCHSTFINFAFIFLFIALVL